MAALFGVSALPYENGENRLKPDKRNGSWLFSISRGILYLLIYFAAPACNSPGENKDLNWVGYTESGKASYYAMKFQSRKTASGELYDKAKKTAAHKKLPFGTKVKGYK